MSTEQRAAQLNMTTIRTTVLQVLAIPEANHRWGKGQDYLFSEVRQRLGPGVDALQVMEVVWQLLSQGLLYADYRQESPSNWQWALSQRGRQVVESGDDYSPDDPERYLDRLQRKVLGIDELILRYTSEALRAFEASCYLATTVMLGVAAERAFQLVGDAFISWLTEPEASRFAAIFHGRQLYVAKFKEFRKHIEPKKDQLPPEFTDNMALTLDSVLDLLRANRNDAGHPTGRETDRGEAYSNLRVFAYHLDKLYSLKNFFQSA